MQLQYKINQCKCGISPPLEDKKCHKYNMYNIQTIHQFNFHLQMRHCSPKIISTVLQNKFNTNICAIIFIIYSNKHIFDFFFFGVPGCSTIRHASSNICCNPVRVNAEHSKYLSAPILFCRSIPSVYVIGFLWLGSSRRSSLVPTRSIGACGV